MIFDFIWAMNKGLFYKAITILTGCLLFIQGVSLAICDQFLNYHYHAVQDNLKDDIHSIGYYLELNDFCASNRGNIFNSAVICLQAHRHYPVEQI